MVLVQACILGDNYGLVNDAHPSGNAAKAATRSVMSNKVYYDAHVLLTLIIWILNVLLISSNMTCGVL